MNFELELPDEFYSTQQDDKTNDPDYEPSQNASSSTETEEVETEVEVLVDVVENSPAVADMRVVESNLESMDAEEFILSNKSQNTLKHNLYVQKLYMDTMKTVQTNKNLPMVPELEDTPKEALVEYLERFFMVCMRKDGLMFNASSIEQFYCVLARILSHRKKDPIDLKSDVMFKRLREVVNSRKEAAVKLGNVPGMWASKSVPHDLITEAFAKKKFSRETPKSLISFTNYIMMVGFGQRAAQV